MIATRAVRDAILGSFRLDSIRGSRRVANTRPVVSAYEDTPHAQEYAEAYIPFDRVHSDEHTLILDDTVGCLGRGDSGYPVFQFVDGHPVALAAMLISGTESCPALQTALSLEPLQPWIERTVRTQGCPETACWGVFGGRRACNYTAMDRDRNAASERAASDKRNRAYDDIVR